MRLKYRGNLDIATVIGIGGALFLIALALTLGGDIKAFFNLPSILIVLGGTFFATMACFSITDIAKSGTIIMKSILKPRNNPLHVAVTILETAETLRGATLLKIQGEFLESLRRYPLFYEGMGCLLDGFSPKETIDILSQKMTATTERHKKAAGILRKAAEIAPAMGLIGTLIGLIQMLGNLDNPAKIGPGMAVALITTFYGAILAYVILNPLAAKLEQNAQDELLINQLCLLGTSSIARQDNPRRTEMILNSILPPAKRVNYFD